MTITTFASAEFSRRASEAKQAANTEPVFITDRGTPTHVLISIERYKSLMKGRENIADLLAMPRMDADFEISCIRDFGRAADFS